MKAYRCAEAIVHHWIPASSVTETWVQKRAERLGYGMPALFPEEVPWAAYRRDVPLKTWLESANWAVRAALLYPLPTIEESLLGYLEILLHAWLSRSGIRRRYASADKDAGDRALKLSVLINNFNYGRYLRPCIDSVLSQDLSGLRSDRGR